MVGQHRFKTKTEDTLFPLKKTLQIKGKLYSLDEPWVMGIINTTPDSFYKGSRVSTNEDRVLEKAFQMVEEGARILDIGGYSTRPNAAHISEQEELNRVISVIGSIRKVLPEVLISIDTFRHKVAKEAVSAGADLVNDISGGQLDEEMIPTVGYLGVPYICMHMRGNPHTMQRLTEYEHLEREVMDYFSNKLAECKKAGIKDVILDLGFGFAKTTAQNYRLARSLDYFRTIPALMLAGVSRKSMVYKLLECTPEQALNGTTALNMALLMGGAQILRVHDVKEATETITIYKQLYT
ncbi:MAG: dihydropteroate synthase [Lunatimonas sp.]|uniref:dihydropteroate synthase n=1 Tax=Lunatimonas sp. TaxID=2060141 RepID=UPI00263B63FC|nr:dihydropteroate synthase [Lunatimonas sp.]MCC5936020.1 dihydropteroate synthase [Lunatimonas sp.]